MRSLDEVVGTNPGAVLDLIRLRARERDPAEPVAPRRKLALVVEGGGMRGVLSAGSLLAVDLLGFRSAFDEIYAASAGAVNAAYFTSGQGGLGITVYFDSINNRTFFNPYRPWKIIDVAYVYDHIVSVVKKLDEDAIRRARTRLYLSVTDAISGCNVLIEANTAADPIPQILKASSALPILYNRTVRLSTGLYVDGGITDPMPIRRAIDRGCTDILVLTTKVGTHVNVPLTPVQRLILAGAIGVRYPELGTACRQAHTAANLNRRLASGEDKAAGVNIATIGPSATELIVDRITMDRRTLVRGASLLANKTCRIFGEPATPITEAFKAFG